MTSDHGSTDAAVHVPPRAGENWGSKLGVILAVAGSAVGLGNFLRFPGTAVNNGGGAFMIPYIVSFLLLGIPIVWCEWTMGRLGGRYGQNNGAGILYAVWRRGPAKFIGALTLVIPITVYMYYVLLEALCLQYAIDFFRGNLAGQMDQARSGAESVAAAKDAVVATTSEYFVTHFGLVGNGELFAGGTMLYMVLACFLINFVIIYRGVTRGIEVFCKFAMPLLIGCAFLILVRAMTLPGISFGLGEMWNPQWDRLGDPSVWLAAAGQIFFSLSVGFGLILCYASYLRPNDDVVLTSLSASSTNEFCEVVLGGLIVVPTAFLFFGAGAAKGGTFAVGFQTIPAIMAYMPGGRWFGGMWFGLLFLAGVTSSLSMLQPAIAFLEDAFNLHRRASVTLLAVITTIGASLVMYYSKSAIALDFTDFVCNFLMIVAGLAQVLIFGWIIGAKRGLAEANRGADFRIPRIMSPIIRFVTPGFLVIVLGLWCYEKAPTYLRGMSPDYKRIEAAAKVARPDLATADGADELHARVLELRGQAASQRPDWLRVPSDTAQQAMDEAGAAATVARFSVLGVLLLLVFVLAAVDIACRHRIGDAIRQADAAGITLGDAT